MSVLTLVIACLASTLAFAEELQNQVVPPQQSEREAVSEPSRNQPAESPSSFSTPADFNREIYYRNKLELSAEAAVLPFNTPLLVGPL